MLQKSILILQMELNTLSQPSTSPGSFPEKFKKWATLSFDELQLEAELYAKNFQHAGRLSAPCAAHEVFCPSEDTFFKINYINNAQVKNMFEMRGICVICITSSDSIQVSLMLTPFADLS